MPLTLLLALAMQSGGDPEAKALITSLEREYASLRSFSATIVHHNDSGLFPGEYTNELKWRSGGRFTLIVTKPSNFKERAGLPGVKAPNYYSDGTSVLTIWPDGHRADAPITIDPNTSPGWEVTGGIVMGWLQSTPSSKMLLDPPREIAMQYRFGKTTKWQGERVREVVAEWRMQDHTGAGSFFTSQDGKTLIGTQFTMDRHAGWMRYRSSQKNPPLADDLGAHPK